MCAVGLIVCRYGTLIRHWTTCFEAKHKYFKHLANVMGNFTKYMLLPCLMMSIAPVLPVFETRDSSRRGS